MQLQHRQQINAALLYGQCKAQQENRPLKISVRSFAHVIMSSIECYGLAHFAILGV